MRALVAAVIAYVGPKLIPTLVIVGLAAVLEGAGIVLLLPLAETIFAQAEGGSPSGITASLVDWMAGHGLDTVVEQLAVMGVGFMVLVVLRAVLMLRRDVLLLQLSQGFVDNERRKFFSLLANCEWPVIKRYRKADLLNAMTLNIGRISVAMHYVSQGLVTAAVGLAYLLAAFAVSWMLGAVLVALSLAGAVFALVWSRRSRRSGERLNRANRGVMDETTRFLDGLKAAKAARAEEELTQRFAQSVAETRAIHVTFLRQQARLHNTIQVLAALAALLVLLVGFGTLGLSGGELLVMAAIILRLSPSLLTTFSGMQSIAHAMPAFAALRQIEAQIAAEHEALEIPRQAPSKTMASLHSHRWNWQAQARGLGTSWASGWRWWRRRQSLSRPALLCMLAGRPGQASPRWPNGLEEQLLDGGARLSGGERQRLCLARALLCPASLLILDEATSAMDPELERTIVATLKQHSQQRIVLMVSHSRNALDLADMRIDVANGKARVVA